MIALTICIFIVAILVGTLWYLHWRQVEEYATRFRKIRDEVDQYVAGLSKETVLLEKRLERLEEIRREEDDSMEQRIAERIERKWDEGLQSILDFNPLTGGRMDEE